MNADNINWLFYKEDTAANEIVLPELTREIRGNLVAKLKDGTLKDVDFATAKGTIIILRNGVNIFSLVLKLTNVPTEILSNIINTDLYIDLF